MSRRCGSSKLAPKPPNGEAIPSGQGAPSKKGKEGGLSVRDRKNVKENQRHITLKGGRGENVSTEEQQTEVGPQPQRGGAR